MLSEHPDLLPLIGSFGLAEVREAIRAVREVRRPGKVLLAG